MFNSISPIMFDNRVINYVILENNIAYDWDDYDLWGAVLYDIANERIVTSKYGHGTGMKEENESITLKDAIDNNIVSTDKLIKVMLDTLNIGFGGYNVQDVMISLAINASLEKPIAIPVNVTRGRKAKGAGYIVYGVSEATRYGLAAYRGGRDYYPIILNIVDKTFTRINSFSYCNIDPEFINNFCKNIYKNTPNTMTEVCNIAHAWAYDMSYSHCDKNNYNALIQSIAKRGFINIFDNDDLTFVNECATVELARLAKLEEDKMNEKLPKIIEWIKANTDKQGDEILELAKHIYHKHN